MRRPRRPDRRELRRPRRRDPERKEAERRRIAEKRERSVSRRPRAEEPQPGGTTVAGAKRRARRTAPTGYRGADLPGPGTTRFAEGSPVAERPAFPTTTGTGGGEPEAESASGDTGALGCESRQPADGNRTPAPAAATGCRMKPPTSPLPARSRLARTGVSPRALSTGSSRSGGRCPPAAPGRSNAPPRGRRPRSSR